MSVTHYCKDGSTTELPKGRYLPDADEYRVETDCSCSPVYHNGDVEHQ